MYRLSFLTAYWVSRGMSHRRLPSFDASDAGKSSFGSEKYVVIASIAERSAMFNYPKNTYSSGWPWFLQAHVSGHMTTTWSPTVAKDSPVSSPRALTMAPDKDNNAHWIQALRAVRIREPASVAG